MHYLYKVVHNFYVWERGQMDIISLLYKQGKLIGYKVLDSYIPEGSCEDNKVRDIYLSEKESSINKKGLTRYTKIDTETNKRISKASIVILSRYYDNAEELQFIVSNCYGVTRVMSLDNVIDTGNKYGIANIDIKILKQLQMELRSLNKEQISAVMDNSNILKIVAGAGTGKTKVMAVKIMVLLATNIAPSNILCITFTNKASNELRTRLYRRGIKGVNIRTIHSECLRLIREDREVEIVSDTNENRNRYNIISISDIQEVAIELLESKGIDSKYEYILVDEFQDTDKYEMEIILRLMNKDTRLVVVGDTDQMIYRFKGVESHIMDLERYFSTGIKEITLTENYRCTMEILNTAKYLVQFIDNTQRYTVAQKSGVRPRVLLGIQEMDLAKQIVNEIDTLRNNGIDYKDIGILYRSRADNTPQQVKALLGSKGIPIADKGITDRDKKELSKKIKKAIQEQLFEDIEITEINECMFGKGSIRNEGEERAIYTKGKMGSSFIEFEGDTEVNFTHHRDKGNKARRVNQRKNKKQAPIRETGTPKDKISNAIDLGKLKKIISQVSMPYGLIGDELGILLETSEDVDSAYNEVIDYLDTSNGLGEKEGIHIMTIHKSKGLEFKYVFIVDIDNGHFPLQGETLEDEIRLAYVAYTRAKEGLYLCCNDVNNHKPSVFITMPYDGQFIVGDSTYAKNSRYYSVTAMDYLRRM